MTWVLFDYGGVICEPQPEADWARLACASGGPVADFEAAYWRYRLDYDRAALDLTAYWRCNAPADVAEAVHGLPLASHFGHLVFSCALKSAKPDPECFRATLAVLGAEPAEVVFLDDRPDNVAAAAALGITSFQFTDAPAARADLARCGIAPA